ncbi:MAG TPA: integration host factor subunit beta [Candidatus Atribacteria bacterium]|nr:integration host factor subunit beta [Candidatus Atribacteria bacterium]
MRKEEIIDIISERLPSYSRKEISAIINEFFEVIKELLAKNVVIELRGFGTFLTKHRNSKKARNPKTGEEVIVKDKRVPYFKPGTIMKKIVNTGKYFKLSRKKRGG